MSPFCVAYLHKYCPPSHIFFQDSLSQPLPLLILMGTMYKGSWSQPNSRDIFEICLASAPVSDAHWLSCSCDCKAGPTASTLQILWVTCQRPPICIDQIERASIPQKTQFISKCKAEWAKWGRISAPTCRLSAKHLWAGLKAQPYVSALMGSLHLATLLMLL